MRGTTRLRRAALPAAFVLALVRMASAEPSTTAELVSEAGFPSDAKQRVQAGKYVTIDRKADYDADDMKVTLESDGGLRAIGKTLPRHTVDGESIGMLLFRGAGTEAFRSALDRAIRQPESMSNWYLSVVDELLHKLAIKTISIEGHWWAEVDSAEDLDAVRGHFLQPAVCPTP